MHKALFALLFLVQISYLKAQRNPFCFANQEKQVSTAQSKKVKINKSPKQNNEPLKEWTVTSSDDSEMILQDAHGNVRHVKK